MSKLTPKQELFVNEYLVDLNATAAYKRAGYKAKGHSAESAAQRLMSNVEVKAAVKAGKEKRIERTQVNQDYVEEILTDTIARCRQLVPVLDKKGMPVMIETPGGDLAAAFVFDAANVARCTDMLAKHVGYYLEDNKQKRPMSELDEDALDRMIAKKAKELGVTLQ